MGTYPTHGAMGFGYPVWWSYHGQNLDSVTILAGRAVVYENDQGTNLAVKMDRGLGFPSRFSGFAQGRIDPATSGYIQAGGIVTNAVVNGTIAADDFVVLSILKYGLIGEVATSTRNGNVFGIALQGNTTAANTKKIRILMFPWRL